MEEKELSREELNFLIDHYKDGPGRLKRYGIFYHDPADPEDHVDRTTIEYAQNWRQAVIKFLAKRPGFDPRNISRYSHPTTGKFVPINWVD